MIDELYIDGHKADMASSSGVFLTYKSNIFSDVSKIVGNYSQTITLPMTGNNKHIFGVSTMPSSASESPYDKHSAQILRDGIVLIKNASAVLLKASQAGYEVVITWGVTDALNKIFTKGALLGDLSINKQFVWSRFGVGEHPADFPHAYIGLAENENKATWHPCVSINELLGHISSDNDIELSFSEEPWNGDSPWVMPLLQRNDTGIDKLEMVASVKQGRPTLVKGSDYRPGWSNLANIKTALADGYQESDYTKYLRFDYDLDGDYRSTTAEGTPIDDGVRRPRTMHKNVKFNSSGSVSVQIYCESESVALRTMLQFMAVNYGDETKSSANFDKILDGDAILELRPSSVTALGVYNASGWERYNVEYEWLDEECDTIDNEACYIFPIVNGVSGGSDVYDSDDLEFSLDEITSEQIEYGDIFDVKVNLPELKQSDLLKGIMQMAGQFAYLETDGSITFAPYSVLEGNKANAYDWSKYLVLGDYSSTSNSLEYKQGEEAQHNKMLYKDSDDFKTLNGEYVVDNETLDYERDAVTLPFRGYKTWGSIPRWDLYTYKTEDDEEVIEYEADKNAYVCSRIEKDDNYYLSCEGLTWSELLESHYSEYVSMLNNAKVITETFVLKPLVLRDMDLRIPVYLKQYGAYFAIIEIKTKEDNKAEVKLIKL